MKTLFTTIASIAVSAMLFISCNKINDDDISSLLGNNELSSSDETIEVSSSSGITQDSLLCDGKPYNPETHFCYIDECGRLPSCDKGELCPDVCAQRETLAEKCNGKVYDPNKEECYSRGFIGCSGQIPWCGGCVQHTTCDGELVSEELCYARPENCELSSSSEDKSSSSVQDSLLCDGKPYNRETHFCYINECAKPNNDATVCVKKTTIVEKCSGKVYDPNTEECYGNFVACKGQKPRCGACVQHTTCDGKPVTDENGNAIEICYDYGRGPSCGLSSSSSISVPALLCDGKTYNPETHFCEIDMCGSHPDCDNGGACPAICYRREYLKPIFDKSSSSVQDSLLCDGKEYNRETQFCYIDECGRLPSCDEGELCPTVCVLRETIAEKCNGKVYDPNTEKCHYNKQQF